MGTFFAYSLKSSICLASFYLLYRLLLSRDTFHRFNRMALLGMMFLSALIPWIALYFQPVHLVELFYDFAVEQLDFQNMQNPLAATPAITSLERILATCMLIYLIGCAICFVRILRNLFLICKIIRKGEHTPLDNNIRLTIHSDNRIAPFSWMNHIVISRSDMNEAGHTILLHEQAHIQQHHTYDLMLAELAILFQWYNPAAWLLYRELQHIHEFEADQSVINQGIDAKQYQLLLIKKAVGTKLYVMANSFDHSKLKKRITMMLQKKSNPLARLKYAYVLPLTAIFLIAFACREVSSKFDEISKTKVGDITNNDKPDETVNTRSDSSVFEMVEEMPEYPGGMGELLSFLSNNVRYPVSAQENGVSGRVVVSFIVEKDGSISNVEVVKAIDPDLDAEAVRVVGSMPKWTPGKNKGEIVSVKFNVPVTFKLSDGQPDTPSSNTSANNQAAQTITPVQIPGTDIFEVVEDMPEYPGGMGALLNYLGNAIKYPVSAQENGVSGRVVVTFIVEKDGSFSNIEVARAIDPALDAEAVRVVEAMPQKWIPGKQGGKAVRVKFNVPVTFRLVN